MPVTLRTGPVKNLQISRVSATFLMSLRVQVVVVRELDRCWAVHF